MKSTTNEKNTGYLKLQCPECGAPIELSQDNRATCPSCGQTFLLDEADGLIVNVDVDYGNTKETKKALNITLIVLLAALGTALIVLLVIFSFNYEAIQSHFFSSDYSWGVTGSNASKKFSEDIFGKPYNEITKDEFATVRYIKYDIDRLSGTNEWIHIIEYSFSDYQDCESEDAFQTTIKRWTCQETSQHGPRERAMDFTRFTGLTRVALGGHRDSFTRNTFSSKADILHVTADSEIANANYIRTIVNPEKVEYLEYIAWGDVAGVKSFPNLKTLKFDIWMRSDFDITEIEHCKNLECLVIKDSSSNFIGLEKIGELKNLKSLSLQYLDLHECDFITKLSNLEQLTIRVDDETPGTEILRELTELDALYLLGLGCIPAKDIEHFEKATTLKLSINTLEAFLALTELPNLKTLDVHFEVPYEDTDAWPRKSVLDMSPLTNSPNLEYLYIQPEANLHSDELYIYGLEQVLNDSKLKNVYINDQERPYVPIPDSDTTLWIDKDSFETNDTLQQLQFVACTFKDVNTEETVAPDFFSHYPNLTYLVVDACGVENISFVTSLPKLKYCSFVQNNLQDFSPLNQCKLLEAVAVYDNPNTTPELSEEIVILTDGPEGVNLTEYLMGIEREVGYIKKQETDEDE